MLVEFRVGNHRSVCSEQVLSLEAAQGSTTEGIPPSLLTVAAIYGANASGKSNFLSAFQFMADAVQASHRLWAPDDGVPREPFAWGPKRSEPTLVEAVFSVGGVRHEYGFVADDEQILEEWLHVWPHRRKQTWFEREGAKFDFGEHLKGENRLNEKVTRPNSLFLSAAVQNRHEQLLPIYRWFRRLRTKNIHRRHGRSRFLGPSMMLQENLRRWLARPELGLWVDGETARHDQRRNRLQELMTAADVGIVGIKLQAEGEHEPPGSRSSRSGVYLSHSESEPTAWLPLEDESAGTQQLLRMAPSLLDTLMTGGVMVVDELEASLHPLLALHLVKTFNDPLQNPLGSQLIFSTHDTHLLGTTLGDRALQRGQVWLSEKDGEGGTQIYPLTDFKPRKDENLERGYLQGRYGAIPFLADLAARKG